MKIYMLKRKDGGVSVMRMTSDKATVEDELAKWSEAERAKVISWREIPPEGVPQTRVDRDLWCDITDAPKIDIDGKP